MNKKFLLGMFAAAGMLLATSCSNDELIEQGSGDTATVSFTVNTEGAVASRAISDGTGATKLYYAVYDANNNLLSDISEVKGEECNDLKTGHPIPLKLAIGQTYTVAFWAQHKGAPYTVAIENGKFDINMNYNAGTNNNETRDAFFKTVNFVVTGNEEKTIELTRPFAQVNVGTDDKEAAISAGIKVDAITSKVVIKNAASTLNVLSGEPSGEVEVSYAASTHPSELLKVAEKDYTWLSMCYVLPAEKEASTTVSAEFTFATDNGVNVTLSDGLQNLPIQRNYRTNIIGSLLTSSVGFKVVIDSKFQEPDKNVEIWDGIAKEQPTLNGDTYEIANAAQWAWLAGNELNKNIKLTGDIDFAGHEVTMVYPNITNGVLDGNGYAIRNAVYVDSKNHEAYKSGLLSFELFQGSTYTIKNLTVENVISSNHLITKYNTYGYAGALVADKQNASTLNIEGVTVKNSTCNGIQSVGALVGLHNGGIINVLNTTVEGNKLCNTAVDGESGYVCGLVGKVVGTLNIGENVVIKNNTIDAFYASKRGATSIDEVAATRANGTITGTATTTGNTVTKKELTPADFTISTAADLAVFADNVELNPTMYVGKVVALSNDIDLAGVDFKVIGHASSAEFRGTFDGRGYTIKNLTINEPAGYAESDAVGFFGWVGNNGTGVATIKNVNFQNANVSGHHNVAIVAGYLQFGHIENCSVDGFELNCTAGTNGRDGDKCGALVGLAAPNKDYVSVKNCTVSNGTIKAVRDAGQAIGCCTNADVRNAITDIAVSNVTVSGNGPNINNNIIGRIN